MGAGIASVTLEPTTNNKWGCIFIDDKDGIIVTGNDVTLYALFAEHYQEYEVLWLGERGRTFFFQNEPPYDPPNQEAWSSQDGRVEGYASFKVENFINEHHSKGFGSYAVFTGTDGNVNKRNAFEVPNNPKVKIEKMCTTRFSGSGNISNVVNQTGCSTAEGVQRISEYNDDQGIEPFDEQFDLPDKESWPYYMEWE